jgi:hypothetical protein
MQLGAPVPISAATRMSLSSAPPRGSACCELRALKAIFSGAARKRDRSGGFRFSTDAVASTQRHAS